MLSSFVWKSTYASDEDDLVNDFYLPALRRSTRYDRAVGFFSSHALALIAPGLDDFVSGGGRMRVLASPKNLSPDDLKAVVAGEGERQLQDSLAADLTGDVTPSELDRLQLLTWMVQNGLLELRIALRVHENGLVTLYHKKVGVFTSDGNADTAEWMTFTGSPNETAGGLVLNAESFSLHRSWVDGQREYAFNERGLFDTAWKGKRPEIWTWSATQWAADELSARFGEREPAPGSIFIDGRRQRPDARGGPGVPDGLQLRGYQKEAISAWLEADGRGTFAMATGTGKTETALAASVELAAAMQDADMPLLVLVIVPLSDLVRQWKDRARLFGFQPLLWDSSTSQAERTAVKDAFRRADVGRSGAYTALVVTTADSLTSSLRPVVEAFRGTILVIGDEMHSLGTRRRLGALPFRPRFTIGLSATPKRHRDDEGTDELLAYFGAPLISISISQAIHELKALCPYRYHVAYVQLTEDEAAEFRRLSKLIAAAMGADRDADVHIRARSNLLAHAEGKFAVLAELMTGAWSYQNQRHELIYVGEGGPRGGVSSVSRVSTYLGNVLGMQVSSYVAATSTEDRERLQRELGSGDIQALVAMKCLDEGVDIPEARVGIILASTQNPRQFVQRRGRILRRADHKVVADIHDVLVVPPGGHELLDSDRTLLGNELSRAFELADAATNRTDAIHSIRTMAIAAGLLDPDYPWMQDLNSSLSEWTAS